MEKVFPERSLGTSKPLRVTNDSLEWEFLPDPRYSAREDATQRYVGSFLGKGSFVALFVGLAFFFAVLVSRLFYLQVITGDHYRGIAEGNRTKLVITKAQRGVFYDRNGQLLVQNVPGFVLALQPNLLPGDATGRNNYLNRLAQVAGIPKEELGSLLAANERSILPVVVAQEVDHETAIMLRLKEDQFPGMILEATSYRQYYPDTNVSYPRSLSHVLGYTGLVSAEEYRQLGDSGYSFTDYLGKSGLEHQYETLLKGKNGWQQVEVDALGRQQKVYENTVSSPGQDMVLSLDLELQRAVEEILLANLDAQKKSRASAIVLDPRNGEVLALVSVPFYDNNAFSPRIEAAQYEELLRDKDKPLFSRAVAGTYPSGSTIKPVVGFGALEAGLIAKNTRIMSLGGVQIGQWFFPDWQAGGHGSVNIYDALAHSVNTFFYYIGGGYQDFQGLGVDRIVNVARRFGLGKPLGIDLPGEAGGLLPTPEWKRQAKDEPWYIGDTYHMAIGQGDLLVTPLQVAAFTAAFANFGSLYRPHLVHDLEASDKYLLGRIDSGHISTVRDGMREVVLRGSGRRLGSLGVSSAGKTGTAQWHSEKSEHAWFTSFAPFENPELVVTVLVEEGGGGEKSALPVAQEIYEWYFGTYKLHD